MLIKIIKNVDTIVHTWVGVEINPGQSHQIPEVEEILWMSNSQLLIDIANSKAVVNNGSEDLININAAITYLKAKAQQFETEPGTNILKSWPSPRPANHSQIYTSRGDTGGFGLGEELCIDLSIDDVEKEAYIVLNNTCYLKGGIIFWKGCNKGAELAVHIEQPDGMIIKFIPSVSVRGTNYLGTALIPVERAIIHTGGKIKIIGRNSPVPSDMEVWGWLAMYRHNNDIVSL